MTCVVAGPALVVIIMIARHPSAITTRKLGKDTGLLLTRPTRYTAHLGPYSRAREGEREGGRDGECANTWGSAFNGLRVGGLGFHRLTIGEYKI